jgi:hypothetical protein
LQLTRNLHREKHYKLSIELNDVDTFWIVQMNDQRHQAVASFNQINSIVLMALHS